MKRLSFTQKALTLGLLTAGMVAGSAAMAQDGGGQMRMHGPMRHIMEADTDGDGAISRAEHEARQAERFKLMDRNGDEMVTEAEIRDYFRLRQFRKMDENGDRSISEDEFLKHHGKHHGKRHGMHGGGMHHGMHGGMQHGGMQHGGMMHGGMHGGGMPHGGMQQGMGGMYGGMHGPMHGGAWFDRADENDDDLIQRSEIESMMEQRFGRMDLNGDGQIDREEMQEMMEQRHRGGYDGGETDQ